MSDVVEPRTVSPSARESFARVVLAVGCAGLLARTIPALVQTYWIDETGTWWLTDGGWAGLVARWREWPYQSLAHAAVALAARNGLGTGEWALRLPSVLAAVVSLVLFHRLAQRLTSATGAAATTLVLLGSPSFFFALTMARPYALGMLALTLSWSALLAWSEARAPRQLALWAAASTAVCYLHYTLALGLLAQLAWLGPHWRVTPVGERRRLTLAAAAALVACLPLAGSVLATAEELPALDMFADRGSAPHLLATLTPTGMGFSLLLVVAVAIAWGDWPVVSTRPLPRVAMRVAAPLWLVPTATTFLLHALGLAPLNNDRYQLAGQMGLALAVGITVDHLATVRAQRTALAVLAVVAPFTAVSSYWPLHDGRDWRAAARASSQLAAPTELVLAPSLFVESNHPSHFAELERLGKLSAPSVVYPLTGRVVPLPRDVLPQTTPFAARRLAQERLDEQSRVYLVETHNGPWLRWLLREQPAFRLVRRYQLRRLDWLVFERWRAAEPPAPILEDD